MSGADSQEQRESQQSVTWTSPADGSYQFGAILEEGYDDHDAVFEGFRYFRAPKTLIWELTGKCELHCSFCFGGYPRKFERELSATEKLNLAHELVAAQIFGINLSGGEPLLCEQLLELVAIFKHAEIPVMLVTSGYGLTKDLTRSLLSHPQLGMSFSLDSCNEQTHDRLRGRVGAYRTVLDGIELLRTCFAEIPSTEAKPQRFPGLLVECVITKHNLAEVEETIEFCQDLGVVHLRIQAVVGVGRGAGLHELLLDTQELLDLKQRIQAVKSLLYQEIVAGLKPPTMQINFVDQATHIRHGIRTGRNPGGIIQPDGTLKVSAYLPYTFGKLGEYQGFMDAWQRGLKAVWQHPRLKADLQNLTTIKDLEQLATAYRHCEVPLSLSDINM